MSVSHQGSGGSWEVKGAIVEANYTVLYEQQGVVIHVGSQCEVGMDMDGNGHSDGGATEPTTYTDEKGVFKLVAEGARWLVVQTGGSCQDLHEPSN
ncbi:hypothetical protein CYMTET_10116 [Cymbomonas tetramitiformis]|uniref:Uncharacterized protein n=1 Tax=Cymbomonas tetramitiformis TaxID=36881 RepID=A0AAE0GQB0_9CHLO|nr:hypothetical protein CYMTET_10116 [Cymbomonas tetramitiformis]